MRHQNCLVKVDYANRNGTGDIIWHLGYQGDFTLLNADGSAATATDWFFAQHVPLSPLRTPPANSRWLCLTMETNRGVAVVTGGTCGVTGQPPCYRTAPILHLDETAMTATLALILRSRNATERVQHPLLKEVVCFLLSAYFAKYLHNLHTQHGYLSRKPLCQFHVAAHPATCGETGPTDAARSRKAHSDR